TPGGSVTDIEAISAVAKEAGVPLIVDNTLATPYLVRPIDHGADIIVHSLTKFLGGHGNSIGALPQLSRHPLRRDLRQFWFRHCVSRFLLARSRARHLALQCLSDLD